MKQFIQRHIVLLGIVIIGALASLGFVACTSDDDVLNRLDENVTADSNPRLRTEAEAIEIAIGNLGMIDRAVPRSRAASDIVAGVSVIGSKVKSRNGSTNDTLLYAVNFKNNEGFALVPASRKADPLLAICEKGNYSPGCEKINPGFGIYMNIAEKRLTDLETVSDEPTLNTGIRILSSYPNSNLMMETIRARWKQRRPVTHHGYVELLRAYRSNGVSREMSMRDMHLTITQGVLQLPWHKQ